MLRLLTILWVFCRFRLDDLLPKNIWTYLLLSPCYLFPRQNRTLACRLRLALECLGPVFIKFGQLLSTRPDILPDDMAKELSSLQDNVPAFASDKFISIVESGLGDKLENLFSRFEIEPLAAASLAQVHSAQLKDGREVVIKTLRPNIERVIKRDLRLLAILANCTLILGATARRLHAPQLIQDYRHIIFNELDLRREAAYTQSLRHNFQDSDLMYAPEIYWPYVRKNIMVSQRLKGVAINDIEALKKAKVPLKELAEKGVQIFFTQVFEHNFFHADMHPGNILVDTKNCQYLSLDCAIMGTINKHELYYLGAMLLAIFNRDYQRVAKLQVISKWVAQDTDLAQLELTIRSLCEPIFSQPIKDISFAGLMVALFKAGRRFKMQVKPELALLEKTIINIEGLGKQLYPELDLWKTAAPFLERWYKKRTCPKEVGNQAKESIQDMIEWIPDIPPQVMQALTQASQTQSQQHPFWRLWLYFIASASGGLLVLWLG